MSSDHSDNDDEPINNEIITEERLFEIQDLKKLLELRRESTELIDHKQLFYLHNIIMKQALYYSYNEHLDIAFSRSCLSTLEHIFWILYSYSLSPKLTMFLCERAIVLFSEYLTISQTLHYMIPHITDIQLFVISKIIGPIQQVETPISQISNTNSNSTGAGSKKLKRSYSNRTNQLTNHFNIIRFIISYKYEYESYILLLH